MSWHANPYPENTNEHADWAAGYENEEAEEHLRFGIDVIRYDGPLRRFEDDPDVVRNSSGYAI